MKESSEDRVVAAVAYLGILFVIPWLLKPGSKFVVFHAKQGLVLFILELIYGALSAVPLIGWFIIGPIGGIIVAVLVIIGLLNALSGETKQLPVIGQFAEKF